MRAVIFDLWETLVDWDQPAAAVMFEDMAARLDMTTDEFRRVWDTTENPRYVAPIREALTTIGIDEEAHDDLCSIRLDYNRKSLVPRVGVVETLKELRRRGYLLGLITVCSEEVEQVFPETQLAGLFDAEVFSNAVGLAKPDPRIYLHCCELLGVEPEEAVFVGDGANDELAGARRVGMEAVCELPPRRDEPLWPEARGWEPTITSLQQVLTLV